MGRAGWGEKTLHTEYIPVKRALDPVQYLEMRLEAREVIGNSVGAGEGGGVRSSGALHAMAAVTVLLHSPYRRKLLGDFKPERNTIRFAS